MAFVGHFKYRTKGEGLDFLGCANVKSEHFQMWGAFPGSKGRGGEGRSKILDLGRCSEDDCQQTGSRPPLLCGALQSTGMHLGLRNAN